MDEQSANPHSSSELSAFPLAWGLLLYVPLIFAGSFIGTMLRYPDLGSAIIFSPYAVLTAALIAAPRRDWIWYILLASVTHVIAGIGHWPALFLLLADVANVSRAVVATLLLQRLLGRQPRLDSVPSLLLFVATTGIVAPAIGAAIGAADVVLFRPSRHYLETWNAWFISNALTALTMLPFLLSVMRPPAVWRRFSVDPRRLIEGTILGLCLIAVCALVLVSFSGDRFSLSAALYAPIPLLIWAALRFGPAGVGLALTLATFAAIVGTDRQALATLNASPDSGVLHLQVFVLLTAGPVMCITVVATARHDAVQLYKSLLASLHDQVAILDVHGVVIRVNDSWRRHAEVPSPCPFERSQAGEDFLGACRRPPAMLAALHPGEVNSAPERVLRGTMSVLSGECERFETEYEQEHAGRLEWYTLRVEPLDRADGGAVVTRANVSARRLAQLEIEEQRRQLSHLARVAVLGQLSGALAHELRQPLTAILANAEAAKQLVEREVIDIEELRSILHDIVTEDRRAAHVIEGLRAMLKRGETRLQPVAPADLVRETLELAHAEIITRRVSATAIVEPDLPHVLADRVQIQQVLLNLVLNACESMSKTAVPDRSLLLCASSAGESVRFSVQDFGGGIPEELIDRLFEPFVTTKSEGLGLGLSIARTVVAVHGGRIWAENRDVRGAIVQVLLPAVLAKGNDVVPDDAVSFEPPRAPNVFA